MVSFEVPASDARYLRTFETWPETANIAKYSQARQYIHTLVNTNITKLDESDESFGLCHFLHSCAPAAVPDYWP
eukprot:2885739-Amphidinium_carterae.1